MKQKKQMYTRFSMLTLLGMAFILAVSCSNSFSQKLERFGSNRNGSGSTGTLTFRISDSGDGSRTILPPTISTSDISTYNLLLERTGFSPISFIGLINLSTSIPGLAIGEWTIIVSGFDSSHKKITEGTTVFNVIAGPCTAQIVLSPIRTVGGNGTLNVAFSYSGSEGDIGQSSVVLKTYPALDAVDISAGVSIPTLASITINTSVPSDTYMLTINLARDVGEPGSPEMVPYPPIKRIVQIYDNRISSATISMTAADLTQPPVAPTNLHITGFDGMNMTLAWEDNSDVEESFILYDGITTHTLSAGTLTNLNYPPASNATLTIKAVNKYGSSSEATLNYVAPTDITLDRTTLVLGVGKSTTLIATVVPNEASLASYINWTSDQENLATVNNGFVTGIVSNVISPVVINVSFPSSIASVSSSAVLTVVETGFADGSGTEADPYLVTTAADLDLVRYAQTAYYSQTEPISFSPQTEWNPIGTEFAPFYGTYNGNGKNITGLYISNATSGPTGLFGATEDSTLREVSLINVNINNNETSTPSSGALVGSAKNTTIFRCFSTGDISLSLGNNVGGLVGSATGGSISESWSSVSVSGVASVGGLIGDSTSTIENCYATGSVYGSVDTKTSGLVGSAAGGSITNSFAAVSFEGAFPGLAGSPGSASITNSYWDTALSNAPTSYGGGTGKTTAEMMALDTFVPDWNFTTVWAINEGKTYPYLKNVGFPIIAVEGKHYYYESTPTKLYTNDSINCGYFNNTGTFNDIEFTLYNNGTSSLNPVITLSNTTIDAYSLLPPSGDPVSPILPGDSYPFTVRFTYENGHGYISVNATLTISSDDPDAPDFVLNLTGSFSD